MCVCVRKEMGSGLGFLMRVLVVLLNTSISFSAGDKHYHVTTIGKRFE